MLAWLRRQIERESGETFLGDDAAVLPAGSFAITVDSQIEGVHFPKDLPEPVLARRLLAVNLSDLAATGALPAYGFLALAATTGFDHRRFFKAFLIACRTFGVRLAGGDLACHPHATSATLTLLGTRPRGGRFLSRSGARAGDAIWLSGTVGESAAGHLILESGARFDGRKVLLPAALDTPRLRAVARRAVHRHLLPEPHLEVGRWLGRQPRTAAIDLSDGLALDLSRLAGESGLSAEVNAAALPFSNRFEELCQAIDRDPEELALGGGEDYVLLFTLPPGKHPLPSAHCQQIGTITRDGARRRSLRLIRDGRSEVLPALGWDHLKAK